MKKTICVSIVVVLLFGSVLLIFPTQAQTTLDTPIDWIGDIDGATFHIRVPEDWNGTLLVYAHGYTIEVPDPPDAAFKGDEFEEMLLDHGYALAGSAFQNAGWAVKEGVHDTLALTNFFREQIGEPETIIVYGGSMGGLITAESIEKFPGIYDAGIPMCGVMAGATETFDHFLNVGLAYDAAFGWPESWGTVDDVNDDVNIFTDIRPVTWWQTFLPQYYGQNEFVRLVNNLTPVGFYYYPFQGTGFVVLNTVLMVYGRAEVEVRANGNPSQNLDEVYDLSADEIDYLSDLGVDAESMLAEMNARTTISADPNARNYLEHYADLTGRIRRPVLTVHTKYDVITPVEMESAYREQVISAGSEEFLTQVYTNGTYHCDFTPEQVLASVRAMEYWLETGSVPGEGFFLESLGFDNNFVPGPWPEP